MLKLSKKLMLTAIAISISSLTFADVDRGDTAQDSEDSSMIGRWVKNGSAIKEYPVCYQLWTCESGKPIMGESISLPKGEWGLCDNYADKTNNNICTKCEAPPPIEVCE